MVTTSHCFGTNFLMINLYSALYTKPMVTGGMSVSEGQVVHAESDPKEKSTQVVPQTQQNPDLAEAYAQLNTAKERLISAALAFCDGSISAGQLRAVRELLREKENRVIRLEGETPQVFVEETHVVSPSSEVDLVSKECLQENLPEEVYLEEGTADADELNTRLTALEQKMGRLEEDYREGRINSSQYRAIRRHYEEQREVAISLKVQHPDSDRWRVVLEEGKTSFLLQLNEAVCQSMAVYDKETRKRIFVEGEMPEIAEEAMTLLRTFGPSGADAPHGRMMATHADDGSALLLIPGQFTAALAVFSQDPPGWQVRALREVHLNFEGANRAALGRGDYGALILPDLNRFVKPQGIS